MIEAIDLAATFVVRIEGGQVKLQLHVATGNSVTLWMDRTAAHLLADQLLAAAQRVD